MISQEAQRVIGILGRDVDEDMRKDDDVMKRPAVVLARDLLRLARELLEARRRENALESMLSARPGPLLQKRVEDLELEIRGVHRLFLQFGQEHEKNLKDFAELRERLAKLEAQR